MSFFKKSVELLTPEDHKKLREIERVSYMQEAEKLIADRGKSRAKSDIVGDKN